MSCLSPMSVPRPKGKGGADRITVPCGVCYECLAKHRREWAFRLYQEANSSGSAYFITLTYDDLHVPFLVGGDTKNVRNLLNYVPEEDEWVDYVVSKPDVQKFLKRLRKMLNDYTKLRYYLVSEYGTKTGRPHYHMIMFNLPVNPIAELESAWSLNGRPMGFVSVTPLNIRRIMYVLKYIVNGFDREKLVSEFALMSRKPGLGFSYVERSGSFHQDNFQFFAKMEGVKVGLPRYLKEKMFTDYESRINALLMRKMQDELAKDGLLQNHDYYVAKFFNGMQKNERFIRNLKKSQL